MSELNVIDFEELLTANGTEYVTVEDAYGPGKHVRLGSVESLDMIQWLEGNRNPITREEAGLRLLVKSIVNKDGHRLPNEQEKPEEFAAWVSRFRHKDAKANGTLIKAALKLNGMDSAVKVLEGAKNDSGEASPDASPIA